MSKRLQRYLSLNAAGAYSLQLFACIDIDNILGICDLHDYLGWKVVVGMKVVSILISAFPGSAEACS